MLLSALAVMGALVAGAAATGFSGGSSTPQAVAEHDGGFGRGYGVFHSYGWARGTAGYNEGACYWHPELCAKDDN
jgi:hypothetical protein